MSYLRIGPHTSVAAGFCKAVEENHSIGANTFQFFTRNPRGGRARELSEKEIREMKKLIDEYGFSDIMAHAPYTVNPASAKPRIRKSARELMSKDLQRLEMLPCSLYNIHPGNHTGIGTQKGIENVASLINEVYKKEYSTTILLETMSGKGTQIGTRFEALNTL